MRFKIFTIIICLSIVSFSCKEASKEQLEIITYKEEIAKLKDQMTKMNSPTLMHTVYIWLKDDLSEADENGFVNSSKTLGNIQSVARFRMGIPEKTESREVVDNSYSYAFNIEFNSVQDQEDYQIDPIHLKFVEDNKDKWTKVIVYDNQVDEE